MDLTPILAMLALRTTPGEHGDLSPSERLMSRKLRTLIPNIKQRYDQVAHDLKPLTVNDTVRFREGKTWSRHGKIIGLHDTPSSYNIK